MASIEERNGSYKIVVSCGRDIYGKKIRETTTFTPDPSLTPKKRQKAVEEFARKFEEQVAGGRLMDGRKITLKDFIERWILEYAPQHLEPGTIEKYKTELEEKIIPALGHYKLTELRPGILNSYFTSLTKDGVRKDGKKGGYSRGTIKKVQDVLSSVLRTAADWEAIEKNPMDKVRLDGEDPADRIVFFTPEQATAFLNYLERPYKVKTKGHGRIDDTGKSYIVKDYEREMEVPEQLKVLFDLAIYAGLRKGELLALEWDDIDFENNTVSVTKATSVVNGQQIIKKPKTKNSIRKVSIPSFLSRRIKLMKVDRMRYKLAIGDRWQGGEWLFIQENGRQMCYSTPYAALRKIINRYNSEAGYSDRLPQIPFHGLRHTSATVLIAGNQDVRTVSARLGHAQTSTTMNIYAHALKESDKVASETMERMLSKQA